MPASPASATFHFLAAIQIVIIVTPPLSSARHQSDRANIAKTQPPASSAVAESQHQHGNTSPSAARQGLELEFVDGGMKRMNLMLMTSSSLPVFLRARRETSARKSFLWAIHSSR